MVSILASGTMTSRSEMSSRTLSPPEKGGFALRMVRGQKDTRKAPFPLTLNCMTSTRHEPFQGLVRSALCSRPPCLGTWSQPPGPDLQAGLCRGGALPGCHQDTEAWHRLGSVSVRSPLRGWVPARGHGSPAGGLPRRLQVPGSAWSSSPVRPGRPCVSPPPTHLRSCSPDGGVLGPPQTPLVLGRWTQPRCATSHTFLVLILKGPSFVTFLENSRADFARPFLAMAFQKS